MYTITLSNGHTYSGARLNGTVYELPGEVSREDIAGGLKRVVVKLSGELGECEADMSGEYENVQLGYYRVRNGRTYVQFNERDIREVEKVRVRGDIDYIAMMTGVEL